MIVNIQSSTKLQTTVGHMTKFFHATKPKCFEGILPTLKQFCRYYMAMKYFQKYLSGKV